MTAGQGYRYLLASVVTGDGDPDAVSALTRYYTESGTPPGRWLGTGLAGLAHPLASGDQVTETQLRYLMGSGQDPTSGQQLGRPYRVFAPAAARIARRLDALPELSSQERSVQEALIRTEEQAKPSGAAVAGFDLTFSAPKSVSTLWAVADGGTQALIARAHHDAIDDVLALLERDVAATRVGAAGPRGAVAQVEVRGLLAAAYDHWDSRSGDPQLHTHVVVANRVQAVQDGKWRTLDSRALHAAISGLSEHYNAVLSDRLTGVLGVGWGARSRGRDRMIGWEIAGVPQALMDDFSSRTRVLEAVKERLVADYVAAHGRRPSSRVLWRMRQQATLATRPEKQHHSLRDLTEQWRARAARRLARDAPEWAAELLAQPGSDPLLRADDIRLEDIQHAADVVVDAVGDRRSTWRRWNLHAEAARQSMEWRFATAGDRDAIVGMIADVAERGSLRLTPPELASSPAPFRRGDGSSVFRPKASAIYSSERVLAAEDRLLGASTARTAPTVPLSSVEDAARAGRRPLSADQEQAIAKVAVSARLLDVLVGPAGAGKTTTMNALRRAWEPRYGPGSVLGLAPSAAAAAVLADDLKIPTENTAKWLYEHRLGTWNLKARQLVIIDEASLAGTLTLDAITAHAGTVGAKVLLVGDWAQLAAVDAGGAFGMLVRDRGDAPELTDVRRFANEWEKAATLGLRLGDTGVIDTYLAHRRITAGAHDEVLETAYQAWRADQAAGKATVLIAETLDTVAALNERARSDRIADGTVDPDGIRLHDGNDAARGDVIITRRNNRRLALGRAWVKNGDRWIVTAANPDGSMRVRPAGSRWHTVITLPAAYVAADVELGYAVTAHRAQGSTVDTAHALVASPEMTREALYVSMTRGRESNRVYIATDQHHLEEHQHRDDLQSTARSILYGILQHVGAELSAHETITAEQDAWGSVGQLAGEYETIAADAQQQRWLTLLEAAGLDAATIDELVTTDAYGVLTAELRRLEADGHDVDRLLPAIIHAGNLEDADDLGSLLRYRLQRVTVAYQPSPRRAAGRIADLIPRATGPMSEPHRTALVEREQLIQQRVTALAAAALARSEPWTHDLPEQLPADAMVHLRVVVAYRDRWGITGTVPLGTIPASDEQLIDYDRARTHLAALTSAETDPAEPGSTEQRRPGRSL
ncbi:TrwC relaxase [Propionibacterium freudenreichii]|nr:TrwC relaxase [Propionibacterium freudenreichii]SBN95167.1 TrwC relaxase [Propionibacterium freudenreichii]SCC96753.1 TrwC relaxase [Propionibacterium freudenreichii]SCQ48150.1 TrwC relaxase [Propionibacterium freudenreichii]SCQ52435.1 TrwC relaxase [Propionibacterium freudenreichii]